MKSPTLTKEIRAQIVESVIAATFIPAEKKAILESAGLAAREAVRAALPEGFERAVGTLPRDWFAKVDNVGPSWHVNPRSILENPEDSTRSCQIRFDTVLAPVEFYYGYQINDRHQEKDPKAPSWEKILAAQIDAAKKLRAKEDDLRADLSSFLASCRTYQQVLEKMPELERHLPKPAAPARPLVVSAAPLQSQMKKLGFDQGAK